MAEQVYFNGPVSGTPVKVTEEEGVIYLGFGRPLSIAGHKGFYCNIDDYKAFVRSQAQALGLLPAPGSSVAAIKPENKLEDDDDPSDQVSGLRGPVLGEVPK